LLELFQSASMSSKGKLGKMKLRATLAKGWQPRGWYQQGR
jgi:hypothetical protein